MQNLQRQIKSQNIQRRNRIQSKSKSKQKEQTHYDDFDTQSLMSDFDAYDHVNVDEDLDDFGYAYGTGTGSAAGDETGGSEGKDTPEEKEKGAEDTPEEMKASAAKTMTQMPQKEVEEWLTKQEGSQRCSNIGETITNPTDAWCTDSACHRHPTEKDNEFTCKY